MHHMEKKRPPVGIENFEEIRTEGCWSTMDWAKNMSL